MKIPYDASKHFLRLRAVEYNNNHFRQTCPIFPSKVRDAGLESVPEVGIFLAQLAFSRSVRDV